MYKFNVDRHGELNPYVERAVNLYHSSNSTVEDNIQNI